MRRTLLLLGAAAGFLAGVRAADIRAAAREPVPNTNPDDTAREAACEALRACDACTTTDGCGWCVDVLVSGDGSATETVPTCVATNATQPGRVPEGKQCNGGFHHLACPCPNHCSGHGTCSPQGVCACFRAFEGDACGREKSSMINPAVVVPVAVVAVGAFVSAIVLLHIKQSGGAHVKDGDEGTEGNGKGENGSDAGGDADAAEVAGADKAQGNAGAGRDEDDEEEDEANPLRSLMAQTGYSQLRVNR